MGYRNKDIPKPEFDDSLPVVDACNGVKTVWSFPCFYIDVDKPLDWHIHHRYHDFVGWPSPTTPGRACQALPHHPPEPPFGAAMWHFIDMEKAIPIHFRSENEGYTDGISVIFESGGNQVEAEAYLREDDDWIIDVAFTPHVDFEDDEPKEFVFAVAIKASNDDAAHPMQQERVDQVIRGKLMVLPGPASYTDHWVPVVDGNISLLHENIRKCFIPYKTLNEMSFLTLQSGVHKTGSIAKNVIRRGLPYSSVFWNDTDILFHRNLSTFYSAVKNPASIVYQGSVWETSGKGDSTTKTKAQSNTYGTMCSGLAGKVLGTDVYYTTSEMNAFPIVFKKEPYAGVASLEIGMPLLMSGHVAFVYDLPKSRDGAIEGVVVGEQKKPNSSLGFYTVEDFEEMIADKGYVLGHYVKTNMRALPDIEYSEKMIPEYGDRTWYKNGDDVWMYLADSTKTKFYYKKDDGDWVLRNLSGLPTKTVNDVTVYNVKELLTGCGKYSFTYDHEGPDCQIIVVDTGNISIDGVNKTVTLSGYSGNLKPSWYWIRWLAEDQSPYTSTSYHMYPAPAGYVSINDIGNKGVVDEFTDNGTVAKFDFIEPPYHLDAVGDFGTNTDDFFDSETDVDWDEDDYRGFSVIVYYENEFGMTSAHSHMLTAVDS